MHRSILAPANLSLKLKTLVRSLLLIMILLAGNQCVKIKYSTSGASIPVEAKTFSVQPLVNTATIVNPNLAQLITDKLRDKMESQTPLKSINGMGDLDFDGTITAYDVRPVSIQGDDLAAKNRLTISIRMRYTSLYEEKFNFDKTFTRFEDFDGNTEFSSVEDGLVELIVNRLIEDIFNESVVNW